MLSGSSMKIQDVQTILENYLSENAVSRFMGDDREIVIYGAGNCGRDVARILLTQKLNVSCFLDNNLASGSRVSGLPVVRPDDDSFTVAHRLACCVIVAIFNPQDDVRYIVEQLKSLGYCHILTFVEFFKYYSAELGNRFWLTTSTFYQKRLAAICQASSLWHDEESRQLYLTILAFRITGNYEILTAPSQESQYFDTSISRWLEPVSFIDCGSYSGDTLDELYRHYGCVDQITAFEPDITNYLHLANKLRQNEPDRAAHIILCPCGVWSETITLPFNAGVGASSSLSNQGASSVQCVALDDFLPTASPTLIKMDIEGAEPQALLGAYNMISRCRPSLAISVYHAPEHLWEILLLIHSWDLGYKFYLRCYGHTSFDAILYAVLPSVLM